MQQSEARLSNRDVAPVAALQSRPQERQMYVTVLAPGIPLPPRKFGTHDLNTQVIERGQYFDLEAR